MNSRLYLWHSQILKKDFVYKLFTKNIQLIPNLQNIRLNTNLNFMVNDSKQLLPYLTAFELITNQKPLIYQAKKSIAVFKLRKHAFIGCKVFLKKQQMYTFLDLFVFLLLPKLVNFKSFLNVKILNTQNMGISDIRIFPQLIENIGRFSKKVGCTITFLTYPNDNKINLILTGFQLPQKRFN